MNVRNVIALAASVVLALMVMTGSAIVRRLTMGGDGVVLGRGLPPRSY